MNKFISEIIKNELVDDNASEVASLKRAAIERINSREVSAHMFSQWINELPMLWDGYYHVAVKDDFGGWTTKEQRFNDAFWLISLSLLSEFKAVNSRNIGGAISAWSQDPENCVTKFDEEAAELVGEHFIYGLQARGWIEQQPKQYMETIAGNAIAVNKFPMTELFSQVYENCKRDLVERAHMHCQPLRFMPQPWTDNFTGVGADANLQLVKGYNKSHISKHVLDAANRAQSVAFEVHPDIKELALTVCDNELDFKVLLGYNTPEKAEKWKGIFKQWQEIARLQVDKPYYFPVTYDFRGRMYYRSGIVSPQASDVCKAAFVFHKGYPLGKTGFMALCVALASALGAKESVKMRYAMVASHIDSMTPYRNDFEAFCTRFTKADKCQAYLLMREVFRALEWKKEHGTFETFKSNVVCHQDGTCSGLQHISIITRDAQSASTVNVCKATNEDKPNDVYGIVGAYADVTRDIAKNPVMLGGYGASDDTIKDKVRAAMQAAYTEQAFEKICEGMEVKAPALRKYTNAVQNRCKNAVDSGSVGFTWLTLDGFEVEQQYIDNSANVFRGKIYSAHLGNRFEKRLDARKMVTATSPNLIHSNDGCHLRIAVNTARMDIALVHDSYGVHPCNYFAFNKVLRVSMYELYKEHDLLGDFTSRNNMPAMRFLDKGLNIEDIKEAVNMFG